jgi:uncharacterized protein (TIGR02594 family)
VAGQGRSVPALSAYELAERFIGVREVPGVASNPQVLAMLRLDHQWPGGDHVPWCSAFLNYIAWLLRLPRSKDLRARSWLRVGRALHIDEARRGFDTVILRSPGRHEPGPEVIDATGHVGLFAGLESSRVLVLGGNQSDRVSVARYPVSRVLGVRRLAG